MNQETMQDTEQDQLEGAYLKERSAELVNSRLDQLTNEDIGILAVICQHYITEADPERRIRLRQAIEAFVGELTLGEWMALGPQVWDRLRTLSE